MESTAPNRRQQIAALLKRYWGFDTFRPVQEQVILSVLAGRDTLALMPTGGGKSLTYQIPGLASQRLMAEGYGFGAEGDWKSAALYRTVWVMNQGLS